VADAVAGVGESDAVARALASGEGASAQWGELRARVDGGDGGGGAEEAEGEPVGGGLPGWLCVALALVEGK